MEAQIPANTLRNADGTVYQAGKDVKSLEELVFTALGEASMCWSERPKGVFNDAEVKRIGEKLIQDICLYMGVMTINEVRQERGLPNA